MSALSYLISQTPYSWYQRRFPMNTCNDEMESGKYIYIYIYMSGKFNLIVYCLLDIP